MKTIQKILACCAVALLALPMTSFSQDVTGETASTRMSPGFYTLTPYFKSDGLKIVWDDSYQRIIGNHVSYWGDNNGSPISGIAMLTINDPYFNPTLGQMLFTIPGLVRPYHGNIEIYFTLPLTYDMPSTETDEQRTFIFRYNDNTAFEGEIEKLLPY